MPSRQQIASALFASCLAHDHKPGKVQFTKYLYLVDYCHWHFHGRQATDINWIFYHYGPWSPAAEECMAAIAEDYGFSWFEEEEPVLQFARVEEPAAPGLTIHSIVEHVVRAFKDREPMCVVEFAYSQTEPMLNARRGDHLDFSVVPVDHAMPQFTPARPKPAAFTLHPQLQERMAAMKAKSARLRQKADERQRFRESADYRTALQMLAAETLSPGSLPDMSGRMNPDVIGDLGTNRA